MSRVPVNIAREVPIPQRRQQLQVLPLSPVIPDLSGANGLAQISSALSQLPGVLNQATGLVNAQNRQDQKELNERLREEGAVRQSDERRVLEAAADAEKLQREQDQLDKQNGFRLAHRVGTDVLTDINTTGTVLGYEIPIGGDPSDSFRSIAAEIMKGDAFDDTSDAFRQAFEDKLAESLLPALRRFQVKGQDEHDSQLVADSINSVKGIDTPEEFSATRETLIDGLYNKVSEEVATDLLLGQALRDLASRGEEGVAGIDALEKAFGQDRHNGLFASIRRDVFEAEAKDERAANEAFAGEFSSILRQVQEADGDIPPETAVKMVDDAAKAKGIDQGIRDDAAIRIRNAAEQKARESQAKNQAAINLAEIVTAASTAASLTVVEPTSLQFVKPPTTVNSAGQIVARIGKPEFEDMVFAAGRARILGTEPVRAVPSSAADGLGFPRSQFGQLLDPPDIGHTENLQLAEWDRTAKPNEKDPLKSARYLVYLNQTGRPDPEMARQMAVFAGQIRKPGVTAGDINPKFIDMARALEKAKILDLHLPNNEEALARIRDAFGTEEAGQSSVADALASQAARADEVNQGARADYIKVAVAWEDGNEREIITKALLELPGVTPEMLDRNQSTILRVGEAVRYHIAYDNVSPEIALNSAMERISETVVVVNGHLIDMTGVSNLTVNADMISLVAPLAIDYQLDTEQASSIYTDKEGLTWNFDRTTRQFNTSQEGGPLVVGGIKFNEADIPEMARFVAAKESEPANERELIQQNAQIAADAKLAEKRDRLYEIRTGKPAPTQSSKRIAENNRMKEEAAQQLTFLHGERSTLTLPAPNFLTAEHPDEMRKQAEKVIKAEDVMANLLEEMMANPNLSENAKGFILWYSAQKKVKAEIRIPPKPSGFAL